MMALTKNAMLPTCAIRPRIQSRSFIVCVSFAEFENRPSICSAIRAARAGSLMRAEYIVTVPLPNVRSSSKYS